MKVESVHHIKGRGYVVAVTLDASIEAGQTVRRADGRSWRIRGLERFCMYIGRPTYVGEKVGLLLDGAEPPSEGDEVSVEIQHEA